MTEPTLRYLQGYAPALQDKVRQLIASDRLGDHLATRYPQRHAVQSDKALYPGTGRATRRDRAR